MYCEFPNRLPRITHILYHNLHCILEVVNFTVYLNCNTILYFINL